eukprot:764199-Hanusia_phi.AAC.1
MEALLDSNNLIQWVQSIFDPVESKTKLQTSDGEQSNSVEIRIGSTRKESVGSTSSITLRSCLSSSKSPSPKCKKTVKFASGDAPWSESDLARRLEKHQSQPDLNRAISFDNEAHVPKRPTSPILIRNSVSPEPSFSSDESSQHIADAQNLALRHAMMARSIAGNMKDKSAKPRRTSPERSPNLHQACRGQEANRQTPKVTGAHQSETIKDINAAPGMNSPIFTRPTLPVVHRTNGSYSTPPQHDTQLVRCSSQSVGPHGLLVRTADVLGICPWQKAVRDSATRDWSRRLTFHCANPCVLLLSTVALVREAPCCGLKVSGLCLYVQPPVVRMRSPR